MSEMDKEKVDQRKKAKSDLETLLTMPTYEFPYDIKDKGSMMMYT